MNASAAGSTSVRRARMPRELRCHVLDIADVATELRIGPGGQGAQVVREPED